MEVFVLTRMPEDFPYAMVAGVFTTIEAAEDARGKLEIKFPFDSIDVVESTLNV